MHQRHLAAALTIAIVAFAAGCKDDEESAGSSDDSGSTIVVGGQPAGTSGPTPSVIAIDTSGGDVDDAAPDGASVVTPPDSKPTATAPSTLIITGTMQLTGSGMSLADSSYAGLFVKAMTADIQSQSVCLDDVDASGGFSLSCVGFQDKQLVVAIIRTNANGSSDLLAIKTMGGIDAWTASASFDLVLDLDTGTMLASPVVQKGAVADLDPSQIKVAQSDFFSTLSIASGTIDAYQTHVDADDRKAVLNGDYSSLPNFTTRTTSTDTWLESRYLKFIASDGFAAPRLQLWVDEEKAQACTAGYAISDGTNSLASITYTPTLSAIAANAWAPKAALDRYHVLLRKALDSGTSAVGADAGRAVVEEFFARLADSRRLHSPDRRFNQLTNTFAILTREAAVGTITDVTMKAMGKILAKTSYYGDATKRSNLGLAANNFNVVNASLGGTGKDFLKKEMTLLINSAPVAAARIVQLGGVLQLPDVGAALTYAQKYKAINADPSTEAALDAAILQLQDANGATQTAGKAAVQQLLYDVESASNIVGTSCNSVGLELDFDDAIGSAAGRAALASLFAKVEFVGWTPALKAGVTDRLYVIVRAFVDAVSTELGGCMQNILLMQSAWNQRSIWNPGTQSYDVVTTDDQRDDGAADTLTYLTVFGDLLGARRRAPVAGLEVRDPNGDGAAPFDALGNTNTGYAPADAQEDFEALATAVLGIVALDNSTGPYQHLCLKLPASGYSVAGQAQCATQPSVPGAVAALSYAQKLQLLQQDVAPIVADEAYASDAVYRAKLEQIFRSSACPPDVRVGVSAGFPLAILGPVYRIVDGAVSNVVKPDGSSTLVVDGSNLTTDKASGSTDSCVFGDVKFLRNLTFDTNQVLKGFVFENGYKNTCAASSGATSDFVDTFLVDAIVP